MSDKKEVKKMPTPEEVKKELLSQDGVHADSKGHLVFEQCYSFSSYLCDKDRDSLQK